MFGFVKEIFVSAMIFFGCNVSSVNPLNAVLLKCILMNNQECRIRPEMININSNNLYFVLIVLK